MNIKKCLFKLAGLSVFVFTPIPAIAVNNVVVIPLFGNGSELKPVHLNEALAYGNYFPRTFSQDEMFTVNDDWAYVVTMLHAYPDRAFGSGAAGTASLRLCHNNGCPFAWPLPNDKNTQLDFGSGYVFQQNGTYKLDFTSFGDSTFDGFRVMLFGYKVRK